MSLLDLPLARLDRTPGTVADLTGGAVTLMANVASRCGSTPQYAALEQLHEQYADRGFTVVGVPCNQFGGQEPGTAQEIAEFCSTTYGVSFPMSEKVDVNGPERHSLFAALVEIPDQSGRTGDVQWNFEKFLIARDGAPVARFGTAIEPDDARIVAAIDELLG